MYLLGKSEEEKFMFTTLFAHWRRYQKLVCRTTEIICSNTRKYICINAGIFIIRYPYEKSDNFFQQFNFIFRYLLQKWVEQKVKLAKSHWMWGHHEAHLVLPRSFFSVVLLWKKWYICNEIFVMKVINRYNW